jgi:uncharacterized protein GlcG (DUF336 family)
MRIRSGVLAGLCLLLAACGSGAPQGGGSYTTVGGGGSGTGGGGGTGGTGGATGGALFAEPAAQSLSVADVQDVIARAAAQAKAEGKPATIAVVDRVGNVLALFRMTGAPNLAHISDAPNGQNIDVQGLDVPAVAAALAKAITGAYLSSGGNAFSSRTASMIVQPHFPPAPSTFGLESGPLFGVQFSQLPCSDLSARFGGSVSGPMIGPKRSPLGLAADPGGFPLYKNGVVVGGIGIEADGRYGFDPDVLDKEDSPEERIALAGTVGFEAPETIRADHIYADGTQLRYSDATYADLAGGLTASSYAATAPALGQLIALTGYTAATPAIVAGAAYGSEASGVRRVTGSEFSQSEAYILTDGAGNNRYPARGGTDAASVAKPLTQDEVKALLANAFQVMAAARAQIRQPLDSRAQVSISVVDSHGQILGIVRSPDAPIFGIDVSLQKARTATFFSHKQAANELLGDPSADVRHFVGALRTFLKDPNALTGTFAFGDRSGGNLSRPYFPDGEVARPHGPFSRPIAQFNPFSTGLQSALVLTNLAQHLAYATGASATDTRQRCTFIPDAASGQGRLQNGIQIFPGSVPIYRGAELVGGIGVSGDGIDQDDMISFLGVHRAGLALGGALGNAPVALRADNIVVDLGDAKVRLRYIGCPFAPFIGSSDQNVCAGL